MRRNERLAILQLHLGLVSPTHPTIPRLQPRSPGAIRRVTLTLVILVVRLVFRPPKVFRLASLTKEPKPVLLHLVDPRLSLPATRLFFVN